RWSARINSVIRALYRQRQLRAGGRPVDGIRGAGLREIPSPSAHAAGRGHRALHRHGGLLLMSDLIVRLLERVHGHVGWLAALALAHPALLLRRPRRNVLGVATAATVLVTLAASLGALLYPAYRGSIKPLLFATAPAAGALFERKEHLGVAALVLAWI